MTEHAELVSEMGTVEKMSTQERLKHARKRRMQQLKRWSHREKELMNHQSGNRKGKKQEQPKSTKNTRRVHFIPSVMLLEAAARNDVDEVRRLLMLGVSPDSTNEDGLTALHQCCIDDSEAMLRALLEAGASVDAADSERWTPLHAAATCGHLHLVAALVDAGADLLAVNADGNMPYDICEDDATLDFIETQMAAKGITQEMIDETRAMSEREMLADLQQLYAEGGDLEYKDHQGATPLHIASANGYLTVVEFILDNHGSPNVSDNDQWQPVHAAACWGHPDVIEMLVSAGADLSAKTKNGETPFDICEDEDLKARIVELRSEMETKRAAAHHTAKLRRTQSQNTRSQSVRRTSIRDKTLISRREAREEARLRHEQQEQSDEDEEKAQQDMRVSEKELTQKESVDNDPPSDAAQKTNQKDPTFTENVSLVNDHDSFRKSNDLSTVDLCKQAPPDELGDSQTVLQPESVKVEIHVTVNTSPQYPPNHGTLSDLKKHRSDLRSRGSLVLAPAGDGSEKRTFSATYLYERPPSPTISLRRFCSGPSEIVGESHNKKCCRMM